jgi:tetratricopeptide (TPR) repeat protein
MWRAIFFLTLLPVSLLDVTAQTPQDLVNDAISRRQAGDLEGAVREYRQFLKMRPEAAVVRSNLGAALAGLGEFAEAMTEYKIALKQSPPAPGLRLNSALTYYKTGRIGDAADELVRVHKESPDNSQATLLLADCYLRMGQNKDVIRVLRPDLRKHPDDMAIAYLLGTALLRDHQVSEGQVLVDRILRNGESAEAHLMPGTAKMEVADFADARDEFAKVVALNPDLAGVYALYAQALQVTSGAQETLKEFKAKLAVEPNNYVANLQIGAMLRQDQKLDEAKPYLERALATRPGDLAVRYQLAAISLSEGKVDDARRELESIVKESPQFTEAHVSLSLAYFRLKWPNDGNREKEHCAKTDGGGAGQAARRQGPVTLFAGWRARAIIL